MVKWMYATSENQKQFRWVKKQATTLEIIYRKSSVSQLFLRNFLVSASVVGELQKFYFCSGVDRVTNIEIVVAALFTKSAL